MNVTTYFTGIFMKGIRIRPERSGLKSSLYDLEADIMEIVWEHNWEEFTVADVHESLLETREIAYTTVMTTVSRLRSKEILSRRKHGRRYVYSPSLSRNEFIHATTTKVFNALPDFGKETAVALLVDRIAEADIDTLDKLESLIQQRRAEASSSEKK